MNSKVFAIYSFPCTFSPNVFLSLRCARPRNVQMCRRCNFIRLHASVYQTSKTSRSAGVGQTRKKTRTWKIASGKIAHIRSTCVFCFSMCVFVCGIWYSGYLSCFALSFIKSLFSFFLSSYKPKCPASWHFFSSACTLFAIFVHRLQQQDFCYYSL